MLVNLVLTNICWPTHVNCHFDFLPARCYASAGNRDRNVSVRLSVCLSVRPSVMCRYCVKTKKASVVRL